MKYSYEELEDGTIAVDIGKLIVDEEDVELASNVYIKIEVQYKNKNMSLARRIMNPPKGLVVDHIDRNSLNNKRSNLKICTIKENNQNKRVKNSVKHIFIREKDGSYSYDPGPLLVDKDDFDLINNIYIVIKKSYKRFRGSLSRLLINVRTGMIVDHIDGNVLNNKKSNLRECTIQQNCYNISAKKGTSNYKGVYFDNKANKWASSISINKKTIYLGVFKDEKMAAKMYDVCANYLYKEFARLNFPNEPLLDILPEEILNRTKNKKYSSKYKGVNFDKKTQKWRVITRIGCNNGKKKYLGLYNTEIEAHNIYENYVKSIKKDGENPPS